MHHLAGLRGIGGKAVAPHHSAFVRARRRLGWEVVEGLFRALAAPLGDRNRDPHCFWHGRRVVALDGTTLALTRNQELERAFGGQRQRNRGGQRQGAPRVRLVSLVECGTRALLDVAFGPYDEGENSLARRIRFLTLEMLVLADRGFPSKPLWQLYLESGADLLWRVKGNIARRRLRSLPDGSYLISFGKGEPLTIRVIEYRLRGGGEVYRLLTNLLDPGLADATELARLYSERWESETLTREIKVWQCAQGSLRSQTQIGVQQEIWSTCVVHTLNRQLAYRAAEQAPKRDSDRISFSLVQDFIRNSLGRLKATTPRHLLAALRAVATELVAARNLVFRRPRSCPRIRYPANSRYPNRATFQGPLSISRSAPDVALVGA